MARIYTNELIGVRQCVDDEILLLNPYQIPLISLLGLGGSNDTDIAISTKHEWFEDQLFDTKAVVTTAAAATDTQIVVASLEPFRPNLVIKHNDELMLVTAVDTTTNKITVTRGLSSTTPGAIAAGDILEAMFVYGTEGSDARDGRYKARVPVSNITQIFDDTVDITGTAEAVQQYGMDDLYESEKQKKQLELALQLEKAIISGLPFNDGNTRMMRGIRNFIQTNVVDAGGADLSLDMINDLAQSIYQVGGFKDGGNYTVMVGAHQKRVISNLLSDKLLLQRTDDVRGNTVKTIVTDFGEFDITLDINLDPDELIITDVNRMRILPLRGRGFGHTYLGKKGDSTQGQVLGEYTFEFKQEKAHGRLKGLK
jgi:hypothetical protein